MHLYKIFSTRHYIALTASVNFVSVVQKRLGMNKFVRTKSPIGSKFSKIFFDQLYTGWIVVVHLYCGFSLWHQMAPQQSAKFRTAFFGHFFPLCGSITSPIMLASGRGFRHLLEDWMSFTLPSAFRSSVGRWRHKIRKFAAEISQNAKHRPQSCAKYFVWLGLLLR